MWYKTKAAKLMGIDYPILQGPFGGGLSTPELVSSVSNKGGLGGYGAYSISPEEIYKIDKRIKELTTKPYNLNLWVSDTDAPGRSVSNEQYEKTKALFRPYFEEAGVELPQKPDFKTRFENQIQVILDLKPKVFSFVFGIPSSNILEEARKRGIVLVGSATTIDEAIALENAGVDAIVASGFESGGHRPSFLESAELSITGSFVLTQLIREKVKLPVITAGGIANEKGIAAAFALGADAVQIGTFMSTLRKAAIAKNKHELVLFWGGQIAPILKHRKAGELMQALIEEAGKLIS
jgi:nitronate monooxygenase